MVLVLVLQVLQGVARLFEDLVLPHQELGAEIFALALAHEGLFVGWAIAVQAANCLLRQLMAIFLGHTLLLLFLPQHPSTTPCTAIGQRVFPARRLISATRAADNKEVSQCNDVVSVQCSTRKTVDKRAKRRVARRFVACRSWRVPPQPAIRSRPAPYPTPDRRWTRRG